MTTQFIQNLEFKKYESTPHLQGSRLQIGDEGYEQAPYSRIAGRYIVAEEKLDGGQSAASFSPGAELLLQSRGHYLMGGGKERQFALFKRWAAAHENALLGCLEDRYIAFGEWMHKKHAMFYDALPHYWNEFDIWDRSREVFLSTAARAEILRGAPVLSVPVLYAGIAPKKQSDLLAEIVMSYAKTQNWRARFEEIVKREGFDLEKAWEMADKSDLMEGLYIKVEEDGVVKERYKFVRADFVQAILDSKVHHSQQPFIPNQLAPGVDIFSPTLTMTWADRGVVTKTEF
jgi:hypothetical protein